MVQLFHIQRNNQIHVILDWLEALPKEQKSGKPVHDIKGFQIVSIPFHCAGAGYAAIVLCEHTDCSPILDKAVIDGLLNMKGAV